MTPNLLVSAWNAVSATLLVAISCTTMAWIISGVVGAASAIVGAPSKATTAIAAPTSAKPSRARLTAHCAHGKMSCIKEIAHRTVHILSRKGIGTGVIYSANEDRAIILTASHVVRSGNGYDSYIHNPMVVWNKDAAHMPVKNTCAYFQISHSDIALIEVENTRAFAYPPLEVASHHAAGGDAYVVSGREHNKYLFRMFTVAAMGPDTVFLGGLATPGDSGSSVFAPSGLLLGVLNTIHTSKISPSLDHTRATSRFGTALLHAGNNSLDQLHYDRFDGDPYICEKPLH